MSPIIKLPGGSLRDEIRQPLFDTIDIAAGVSPIAVRSFFSAVQGKDITLTNLRQNNLLETAVSYRLQGMALDSQNDDFAKQRALYLIQEHSAIEIRIGEKNYWTSPLTMLGGRLWQTAAHATTVAATTLTSFLSRYGDQAVAPVVLLGKHVVDINPLQSFRADLTTSGMTAGEITDATPAAGKKLRLIFSFKGLQRRPVQ